MGAELTLSCVISWVGSKELLLGSRLSPLKTRAAASIRRQPWIFAANPVQTSSFLFFKAVMFAMLALSPPILTLFPEPAPRSAAFRPVAISPRQRTTQSMSGLRWIALTIELGILPPIRSLIWVSCRVVLVLGLTAFNSLTTFVENACRIG